MSGEESEDQINAYISQLDDLRITPQYLFNSFPVVPSFQNKDIKVKPNSKTYLYILFESINQTYGPHILLIKDKENKYYYKRSDFWESDTLDDVSSFKEASANLILAEEEGELPPVLWVILTVLVASLVFRYFLFKNVKLLRNEESAKKV